MARGEDTSSHPGRQVGRGRFLPSAPDTHTTSADDAAAYASNNVSHADIASHFASLQRSGGYISNAMYREMGYDD